MHNDMWFDAQFDQQILEGIYSSVLRALRQDSSQLEYARVGLGKKVFKKNSFNENEKNKNILLGLFKSHSRF